ncbi:MAG TPA: ABC transporter substrate-binding protein [Thermomicrobiales bacterium]|nr:ABC transporter substrate-binding protein [Thermomicrobiales bacterium]
MAGMESAVNGEMDEPKPARVSRRWLLRTGLGAAAGGALAVFLSACGSGGSATNTPAAAGGGGATSPAGGAATKPAGGGAAGSTAAALGTPVGTNSAKPPKNPNALKLEFWHAMGGQNGATVTKLVDQYNDSQSDVYVEAIYQGSYDDTLTKVKAGLPSKTLPHMVQIYDIGLRFMIDSKAIEPMQTFIDADKFDTSQFEAAILNYYTVDKRLYSMPFNTSNPILYYNKKAFQDAGLDPAKPPQTWADVEQMAGKLVKKDSSGKVTQYGISIAIYGWFFEQFLATENALYADPDNGRGAQRATKVVYNQDPGVKIVDWWNGLVQKGVAVNLGRNTSDTQKAFIAGQIPMTIDSTAVVRQVVSGAGDKFEVGTGYMPRPDSSGNGGIIMGGASLYITQSKPDKEKQASWKFVQWLAQPQQQAFWHINTGYFPVRKDAYELPEEKDNAQKYPQFQTAVNQLHDTKLTPATSGAVLGVFAQSRASTETAIESVILGKAKSKDALDQSANDINNALKLYNDSVK